MSVDKKFANARPGTAAAEIPMTSGGHKLRQLRERLGLSMRDVEMASNAIAERHRDDAYSLSLSRLSEIESKGVLPNIYKVYSLSIIYRIAVMQVLAMYGINMTHAAQDVAATKSAPTQMVHWPSGDEVRVPVRLDPGFDLRRTTDIGRMVQQWGAISFAQLEQVENSRYAFGYVGAEDYTMYPLLMPGTFVQIDPKRNRIQQGRWRSEYERPIYFIEMRNAYACCWCDLDGENLVLQPHPLSNAKTRVFAYPQDADIVGQVVGIAMRLDVTGASSAPKLAAAERTPAR
jgi:hypothetical protein